MSRRVVSVCVVLVVLLYVVLSLAPAAQPPAAAEADKRDAERYRALRKAGDVSISCDHGDYTQYVESGEELDDLCDNHLSGDAAMGKEGV